MIFFIYSNPIWVVGINEPETQAQQGANIRTYLGLLYSNPIWVIGINDPETQAQQGANIRTYLGLL